MPILKYFLTVGLLLTGGLWALGTYLEAGKPAGAHSVVATTETLAIAKPSNKAVEARDPALDLVVAPQKEQRAGRSGSRRSSRSHRRAGRTRQQTQHFGGWGNRQF
jgi:hypothetical protein